jgi:hypothetical protein
MAIPESQLATWSHPGATVGSAETHKSLRSALASHDWPSGMAYEAYLQGSYANASNIRGNSDVDLVVETDSVYYSNLREEDKPRVGWTPGRFNWHDFRREVLKALQSHYDAHVDGSGNKCIRVNPAGNRLAADVVPCVQYQRYKGTVVEARGMTFWTHGGLQIINYPKLHLSNGAAKNERTSGRYKPAIRMFKNAREQLGEPTKSYPSYFLECLIYNVPDNCFQPSFAETLECALRYLCEKRDSNTLSDFVTQSGQHWLFGSAVWQSNDAQARALVNDLVVLWNDW